MEDRAANEVEESGDKPRTEIGKCENKSRDKSGQKPGKARTALEKGGGKGWKNYGKGWKKYGNGVEKLWETSGN